MQRQTGVEDVSDEGDFCASINEVMDICEYVIDLARTDPKRLRGLAIGFFVYPAVPPPPHFNGRQAYTLLAGSDTDSTRMLLRSMLTDLSYKEEPELAVQVSEESL